LQPCVEVDYHSNVNDLSFSTTRYADETCLCLHVQRAARRLARRLDNALRPIQLTNGQFSLLAALDRPEPARMGPIAELLAMDRTTLIAALKLLERRGLVDIAVDPRDRRGRLLSLTEAGHRLLAAAMPIWTRFHAAVTARLPEDEADRLRTALRAIS
jgi:DNA-binding MarR family transcriptional regulator